MLNLNVTHSAQPLASVSTCQFVPQPIDDRDHFIQNRIYVGNFPSGTTQRDITKIFHAFGDIIETNIVENNRKRFGFVTFRDITSADNVLTLYCQGFDFYVNGYVVKLNRAHFRPKHHRPSRMFNNHGEEKELLEIGIIKPGLRRARYSTYELNSVIAKQSSTLTPKTLPSLSQSMAHLVSHQKVPMPSISSSSAPSHRLTQSFGPGYKCLPPVPFLQGVPTKSISQPSLVSQVPSAVRLIAPRSTVRTHQLVPGFWCYNSPCELSIP